MGRNCYGLKCPVTFRSNGSVSHDLFSLDSVDPDQKVFEEVALLTKQAILKF